MINLNDGRDATRFVLTDVMDERKHQDREWPGQATAEDTPWLAILTEEVGEVARATLGNEDAGNLRQELIQVAAVAVAWVEWMDRREHRALSARRALEDKAIAKAEGGGS